MVNFETAVAQQQPSSSSSLSLSVSSEGSESSELSEIVELPNIEEEGFDSVESRTEFIWFDMVDHSSWVYPPLGSEGVEFCAGFSEELFVAAQQEGFIADNNSESEIPIWD